MANADAVRKYKQTEKGKAATARSKRKRDQSGYMAAYYVANRDAILARTSANYRANADAINERQISKRFNVDRAELMERQGNACPVCDRQFGEDVKPHVDHDHSCCPGSTSCGSCVRAVLCGGCNVGLGSFGDDPERLISAAAYLLARENVLGGTP